MGNRVSKDPSAWLVEAPGRFTPPRRVLVSSFGTGTPPGSLNATLVCATSDCREGSTTNSVFRSSVPADKAGIAGPLVGLRVSGQDALTWLSSHVNVAPSTSRVTSRSGSGDGV